MVTRQNREGAGRQFRRELFLPSPRPIPSRRKNKLPPTTTIYSRLDANMYRLQLPSLSVKKISPVATCNVSSLPAEEIVLAELDRSSLRGIVCLHPSLQENTSHGKSPSLPVKTVLVSTGNYHAFPSRKKFQPEITERDPPFSFIEHISRWKLQSFLVKSNFPFRVFPALPIETRLHRFTSYQVKPFFSSNSVDSPH